MSLRPRHFRIEATVDPTVAALKLNVQRCTLVQQETMSAYDSIPENNAESGGVIGAQTWVSKYLLGWIPDSVNLEMFDPSTSRPFPERVQLINEYCARWGEFFDLSEYNIPTMGEIKERLNFNVARFFFNCTYRFRVCVYVDGSVLTGCPQI